MQLPLIEKWSLLAGLRFLLASIVAVNHLPDFIPIGGWSVIPRFGAFEAILGFLLISGYSIGASYMKQPDGFVWRRIKRIYPVYLASIALVYLVFMLDQSNLPSVWVVLANVLFLNQIVTATSFVGPAWSLALEFWLYCLTPLLFLIHDANLKKLVWLSFGAFVVYTCGRTLFHWNYYSGLGFGLNLLLLSFIWVAGLRLARNGQQPKPILMEVGLIFSAHILLSAAIQFASRWKHGEVAGFFLADLPGFALQACTLILVLWSFFRLLTVKEKRAPASAWLRTLGDISYPLYLVHIPVYFFVKRAGFSSPLLYFAAAVVFSALMYKVLDLYSQRRHLRPALSPDGSAMAPRVRRGEG